MSVSDDLGRFPFIVCACVGLVIYTSEVISGSLVSGNTMRMSVHVCVLCRTPSGLYLICRSAHHSMHLLVSSVCVYLSVCAYMYECFLKHILQLLLLKCGSPSKVGAFSWQLRELLISEASCTSVIW